MEELERQKTIIYGGAFNPPTIAHEAILAACVDYAGQNRADLWLLPSGDRHDKRIPTDRKTRLLYLDAMLSGLSNCGVKLDVATIELDRPRSVQTIDTVHELDNEYPDRKFIWVFGADSVETMANWNGGEWMLENLQMLVINRRGHCIGKLAKKATKLAVSIPDASSTEVRRRLSLGEPVDDLVSSAVDRLLICPT